MKRGDLEEASLWQSNKLDGDGWQSRMRERLTTGTSMTTSSRDYSVRNIARPTAFSLHLLDVTTYIPPNETKRDVVQA